MRERHPKALARLYRPMCMDRQAEHAPDAPKVSLVPVAALAEVLDDPALAIEFSGSGSRAAATTTADVRPRQPGAQADA
jgi:hypothetical protein